MNQPIDRRTFNRAAVSAVALSVFGCPACEQGGGSGQAAAANEEHRANLARRPFAVGPVSRFAKPGVYTGYKADKGVWVISDGKQVVVLSATCTHLRCTTYYRKEDDLYHCPCHHSEFTAEGIHQPGSKADRPLERCHVELVDADEVPPKERTEPKAPERDEDADTAEQPPETQPSGPWIRVDPRRRYRKDQDEWENPRSFVELA